jgi:branched-chain amino acid transport system permease protein
MIAFLIYLTTIACIWGILAVSLNLQYGITGLVNLGQIAFFMIGGYVSVILVMLAGWPIGLGMVGGMVAAALFGMLLALPTARLQQDYWGISTLAAAEIARLFFLNQTLGSPYVGGSFGVTNIPQPLETAMPPPVYPVFYLGLSAVCLLLCCAVSQWLMRLPFGRALKAMREGDEIPLALGKNVSSLRISIMGVGGALGGLAGALFAHFNAFIAPDYFLPLQTFMVWAMVIVGGPGNFAGVLVGAFLIEIIDSSTRFLSGVVSITPQILGPGRMILISVLVILVLIYAPEGLLKERRRRYAAKRR